jgi:HEAT repeat protein
MTNNAEKRQTIADEGITILIKRLQNSSPAIRASAAEHIGKLKLQAGIKPLISQLNDHYRDVRLYATTSLGVLLEGQRCPKSLINMLKDPDEIVRIECLETLERIADKRALPAIKRTLHDRSPLVRGYAILAIARLGGNEEIYNLQKLLKKEKNAFPKACLFSAIYSLGNRDSLKDLLLFLCHGSYRIRCATANILGGLNYSRQDRIMVLKQLISAFRRESTIAAKSSLRSSIKLLK